MAALFFSVWAIRRHASFKPRPMLVPAPRPAPTYNADAGESPVPDLTAEPD